MLFLHALSSHSVTTTSLGVPRRKACARRGATLVEFALIAPIFFAAVFAVVSFSLYVLEVQVANQSAQAAARWAVAAQNFSTPSGGVQSKPQCPASTPPPGMLAAAEAAAGPFAGSLASAGAVVDNGATATSGGAVGSYYCQVTVSLPYVAFTGLLGIGPRSIAATAIDYVT